jgi:hypothetical protein
VGRRVSNHTPTSCGGPYHDRGIPGIEPGTSRTRSEHNATIPNPRGTCHLWRVRHFIPGHRTPTFFCFSLFPTAPRLRYHTVTLWLHVLDQKKAAKSKITSELYQEWLVNHCVFSLRNVFTQCGARTHDHKIKSLALCRLS